MVGSGSSLLYKGAPNLKNASLIRLAVRDCGLYQSRTRHLIACIVILEIYVHYVHHSAPTPIPNHFDVQIKTSPKISAVLWAIGKLVMRMECSYPSFIISEPEKKK